MTTSLSVHSAKLRVFSISLITAVVCSSIWIGDSIPVYSGYLSTNILNLQSGGFFTYLPFDTYDNFGGEWVQKDYDLQEGGAGSMIIEGAYQELSLFNNTTYSDHINFGIEQIPKQGTTKGNDRQYVATQMYNFYLLNMENLIMQAYSLS